MPLHFNLTSSQSLQSPGRRGNRVSSALTDIGCCGGCQLRLAGAGLSLDLQLACPGERHTDEKGQERDPRGHRTRLPHPGQLLGGKHWSSGPAWPGCPLAAGAPPRLPGSPVCALRVPQAGVDLPEAPGEGTHTRTYVAAAPRTLSLPFGACSLLPPVWARGVWSRGALSPARGVGEKAQRGLPASSLPCEERALAHSASLQPVGTREAGKGQRKGVGRGRAGGQAH